MTSEPIFAGLDGLVERIQGLARARAMIAIAGPPGAGKSTLAAQLAGLLNSAEPGSAEVVPMDGYHYDDAVLRGRGLLERKGSPPTFDAAGLRHMLARLRANAEAEIAIPVFDRALEISRAGGRIVPQSTRRLIIEGNYLLLDEPPWTHLAPLFDITAMLREDRGMLEQRLLQRWRSYGFDADGARRKVAGNDLPNVDLVLGHSRAADVTLTSTR